METTELKIVEEKKHLSAKTIMGIISINFIIIVFTVFLGITIYISSSNKIIPGIYVKGVEISGLTKEQAVQKITNEFNNVLPNYLTVFHGDYETQLNLEDIGANFNIEEVVNRAYNLGREGNIFRNMGTIMKNLVVLENLDLNVSLNNEQTTNILNDISTKIPDAVVQSSYYVDGKTLVVTRGKAGNVVDVEKSMENIKNRIADLTFASNRIELVTIVKEPEAIDMDKIHNEIYKEPVDAYYSTNPYVVHPHENGVDFNISVDEAKAMLNEVKDSYEIPLKYTAPNVTTNMIGTEAFPDLISKFSTKYNARDKDRTTNLKLAAEKINGTVLMPGETFSYNTVVGERTIAAGYKEAPIYQNGEVVDGLGGGICQISTTLYNAALFANLEIVERRNHQFVPSYANAGRDATVVYGAIDFRFKNTRNYPIKIICTVSGGIAKCEMYGLKENPDYEVEITSEITEKTSTSIKSATYKTVKQNGQIISSERISRDTYKRH